MESGSTVSSSFGQSADLQLISHFGPFAVDATAKKKIVILLSLLIVDRDVHAVFKISFAKLIANALM